MHALLTPMHAKNVRPCVHTKIWGSYCIRICKRSISVQWMHVISASWPIKVHGFRFPCGQVMKLWYGHVFFINMPRNFLSRCWSMSISMINMHRLQTQKRKTWDTIRLINYLNDNSSMYGINRITILTLLGSPPHVKRLCDIFQTLLLCHHVMLTN